MANPLQRPLARGASAAPPGGFPGSKGFAPTRRPRTPMSWHAAHDARRGVCAVMHFLLDAAAPALVESQAHDLCVAFRIVRVPLCGTYCAIACVQVVSVVALSAGVYLLACGLLQTLLKRAQTVIRSTKRPPRANLLQMWGRCRGFALSARGGARVELPIRVQELVWRNPSSAKTGARACGSRVVVAESGGEGHRAERAGRLRKRKQVPGRTHRFCCAGVLQVRFVSHGGRPAWGEGPGPAGPI